MFEGRRHLSVRILFYLLELSISSAFQYIIIFRSSTKLSSIFNDFDKAVVVKMASHAIFQYNVLAMDDTHNTWTNMIVKINIPRLLDSSDDKEKIGVARPEDQNEDNLLSPVKSMMSKLHSSV